MRHLGFFSSAFLVASIAACISSRNEDVASAEHADTAADLAEARGVFDLLDARCQDCHAITIDKVRTWGNSMRKIETDCINKEGLTPQARIDCLRSTPTDPESPFAPKRLGLYAPGVDQENFKALFNAAFPAATAPAEHAAFVSDTQMPKEGAPLTADEFGKIKKWVLRGMPQIDRVRDTDAGPLNSCTPSTTPELAAHLANMKTSGWGARLADEATPMLGCGAGAKAIDCLADFADATSTFADPTVTQKLRQLRKASLSHYWVRSSADGRYVGFGISGGSRIIDLTQPETAPGIKVAAPYDPIFLASNDGFGYAGTSPGGIRICKQSLLADVANDANPSISFTEAKCAKIGSSVYESIGTALEGGRYVVTWGEHENDDGGNSITKPQEADYRDDSKTTFVPMVNDGQSFKAETPLPVAIPGEGDMMLSPSSLLGATRVGRGEQIGYRVHFIQTSGTGATFSVAAPVAAQICMTGGKASFSFDERFVAVHQYSDGSLGDAVPSGSSNIVVHDLLTSKTVRITQTKKGQFALYPHFRADGWLYFIVRDMNERKEYVIASDIALQP